MAARAAPTTTTTLAASSPASAAAAAKDDDDLDGFYSDAAAAASSDSATPLVVYEAQYPDHNLDVQVTRLKAKSANGIKTTTTVSVFPTPGAPPPPSSLLVHWGSDGFAVLPDKRCWPAGSNQAGEAAVQTPLGEKGISVVFESDAVPPPPSFLFVLHDAAAGTWANDQGRDFRIPLSEPSTEGLLARVLGAEGNPNGTWSLFNRFALAADLLPEAEAMGSAGIAVILAWLRLSAIRVLPWYGGTCYQSKDAAHIQQRLAERVAALLQEDEGQTSTLDGEARSLARAALALLYRGALAHLVHRYRAPLSKGATEGDCLRKAQEILPQPSSDYFERLTRTWLKVAYADLPPEPGAEALCREWHTHFQVISGRVRP